MGYGIFPESNDDLCDYNYATQECNFKDYGLYLGFAYLFPGIIIGFGIMSVGCFLVSIYACCRKIGGPCQKFNPLNYTTPETCGGRWPPLSNGWICRFIVCILVILSSLLLLAALFTDIDVNDSTSDFRDKTVDFVNSQVDAAEKAIDVMEHTYINSQISTTTKPLYDRAQDYIDMYNDYSDKIEYLQKIQLAKFITECVFVACMLILAVFACVAAGTGWRPIFMCFIYVSLMSCFILSLFYSYCIASEALYGDFCNDNEITLDNGNSALKYGILPCDSPEAQKFRHQVDNAITEGQAYSCGYVNSTVCSVSGVYCDGLNCTLENVGTVPDQIYVDDTLACGDARCPPGPCTTTCVVANRTLAECKDSCVNTALQSLANETVFITDDAQVFSDQIYDVFLPLLNCVFVREYVVQINDDLCTGMIRIGIVGLLTLLGVAVFVVAIVVSVLAHNAISEHVRLKDDEDIIG